MSDGPRDPRLTEARNPRTEAIDRADALAIVRMMQAEDLSVTRAVSARAEAIARVVEDVAERFRRGGRLIYVGAGTSGRLGVLDASECPPTFGTDPSLVRGLIAGGERALVASSEGAEDDPQGGARAVAEMDVGAADFVLGIATSGTTPYVHGALEEAVRRGAGTGFLCCSEAPGTVRGLVGHVIDPLVGPEVIAGSTRLKAGTATKLVLNTITTGAMIRTGRVYRNFMVDLRARSAKLVGRGIRIVAEVAELDRESARRRLLEAGGAVKTALAMELLGLERAMAERYLDAAGGFLGEALDRHGAGGERVYGMYPEAPGWPDEEGLLARLEDAPSRLDAAREAARAAEASGRLPLPGGWSAARHVAHLEMFEREAVQPRLADWLDGGPGRAEPRFADWDARPPPEPAAFEAALAGFEDARRGSLERLGGERGTSFFARRARVGAETLTLYQFLRGVSQHDLAHARRIEERVHPALHEPLPS